MSLTVRPPFTATGLAAARTIAQTLHGAGWYRADFWSGMADNQRRYAHEMLPGRVTVTIDRGLPDGTEGSIHVDQVDDYGHTAWSIRINGDMPPAVADALCAAIVATSPISAATAAVPALAA